MKKVITRHQKKKTEPNLPVIISNGIYISENKINNHVEVLRKEFKVLSSIKNEYEPSPKLRKNNYNQKKSPFKNPYKVKANIYNYESKRIDSVNYIKSTETLQNRYQTPIYKRA